MVSVTYTTFHDLMNLTTTLISAADTEALIDQAIDMMNLYFGTSLSNMTGSAGSKTVTLAQEDKAAVMTITRTLYLTFYLPQQNASLGGVSSTPAEVFTNPNVQAMLKIIGRMRHNRVFERT